MKEKIRFDSPGTLKKPGPIGRVVRLGFGVLCLWFFYTLIAIGPNFFIENFFYLPGIWFSVIMGFYVFPYVVNIGFTVRWGRWPQHTFLMLAAIAGAAGYFQFGEVWAPPLGFLLYGWLLYVYAHLGFSFLLSAVLATPGCEMRALPHLWTKLSGRKTREHYCPGIIDHIDRWEAGRAKQ
ncbi:MAG: hypothetical protein ACE5I1_06775 [bacterium]